MAPRSSHWTWGIVETEFWIPTHPVLRPLGERGNLSMCFMVGITFYNSVCSQDYRNWAREHSCLVCSICYSKQERKHFNVIVVLGILRHLLRYSYIWECQRNQVDELARAAVAKSTDRVAYTIEIYFLTVMEARSPRSWCWQGWFLLRSRCLVSSWSSTCVFLWSTLCVRLHFLFL